MKKTKSLLLGILAFCCCVEVKAQDPQFSQYYANKLWLSPAFAGSGVGPRFITSFRSQWAGIPGAFRTMNTSFDMPIYFGNVQNGIGLNVLADQAGDGALTTIQPTFQYSFLAELGDHSGLRLGLQAGIQYNSIDFYALRFPDQLLNGDGTQMSQEFINRSDISKNTRMHEEVGFGAIYYNRYLFMGATAKHLTQPQQRFLTGASMNSVIPQDSGQAIDPILPMQISGFVGGNIPLDRDLEGNIAIIPTVLYRQQGPFQQIDAGMYFKYSPLIIGVYYRAMGNDALIAIVGIEHNNLRIGYSYDYTMSDITNSVSGGSHELTLSYEFERQRKKRKPKPQMSCPEF